MKLDRNSITSFCLRVSAMSETETSWHQLGRTNRESQGLAGDGKVMIWLWERWVPPPALRSDESRADCEPSPSSRWLLAARWSQNRGRLRLNTVRVL